MNPEKFDDETVHYAEMSVLWLLVWGGGGVAGLPLFLVPQKKQCTLGTTKTPEQ